MRNWQETGDQEHGEQACGEYNECVWRHYDPYTRDLLPAIPDPVVYHAVDDVFHGNPPPDDPTGGSLYIRGNLGVAADPPEGMPNPDHVEEWFSQDKTEWKIWFWTSWPYDQDRGN
jgi:hypothetical protein